MTNINYIDGFHEIEYSNGSPFRWTSDSFSINIHDISTKFLLHVDCCKVSENYYLEYSIDKWITSKAIPIESGMSILEIYTNGSEIIEFKSSYFIPHEINNSKDFRKLGIKIYKISILSNNSKYDINISDIKSKLEFDGIKLFLKNNPNVEYNQIKQINVPWKTVTLHNFKNDKFGKLNLNNQLLFYCHRSGWAYVIDSLKKYHNDNGVKFYGFLEREFLWDFETNIEKKIIPLTDPWIGVIHNPFTFSIKTISTRTTEIVIKSEQFQNSLNCCKGLYVLSNDLANKIIPYCKNVDVNVVYLPTEIPQLQFSFDKFINNSNKQILEVGTWLRKINSIYQLQCKKIRKVKIKPFIQNQEDIHILKEYEKASNNLNITQDMESSVSEIDRLDEYAYDEFLSNNIAFLDLYESSANNAIVECIARMTPVLVNRLPSVEEYLGKDYPFYFSNIEEASEKVNNLDLINETHEYLKHYDGRTKITKEYFLKRFEESNIYKKLYG